MIQRIACACAAAAVFLLPAAIAQEEEAEHITTSSSEFLASSEASLELLASSDMLDSLLSPPLNSKAGDRLEHLKKQINQTNPPRTMPHLGLGSADVIYDVILQPGHYLRTRGKTGAQGEHVSERELVAYVTAIVASELRLAGYSVLVVSADDYIRDDPATPAWEGLQARSFISIHAEGSVNSCSAGPSLGYASGTSPHAMHAIGLGLASALGYAYSDFMRDSYTANSARYYMFNAVQSDGIKGLVEIGEVTCPASEVRMVENADLVGKNIAQAMTFILSLPGPE